MDILIALAISLLIISKLLDMWTTYKRIQSVQQEQNPLGRKMMHRWGVGNTIIIIGLVSMLIIVPTGYMSWQLKPYSILFGFNISMCLLLSLIQFAVAHSNWFGKDNIIVRWMRKTLCI